jgi:hypothetical protein
MAEIVEAAHLRVLASMVVAQEPLKEIAPSRMPFQDKARRSPADGEGIWTQPWTQTPKYKPQSSGTERHRVTAKVQ